MRKRNTTVLFTISMAMVILLAACDAAGSIVGDRDDIWQGVKESSSYRVSFDAGGGTPAPSQSVRYGTKATRPDNPEKEGFSFVQWTRNTGGEWVFSNDIVVTDITLYARWKKLDENHYNIIFKPNNGSVIDNQVIERGKRITQPEGLELTRAYLEGWYIDDNYLIGAKWNFGVPPAENLTLYARWIALDPNQYTVRFVADGGFPAPYDVPAANGATVAQPPAMSKGTIGNDAETFGGWYQNTNKTIPWIFENDTVTGSVSLYARWNPFGYYTVNFNANSGTPARHQKIIKGEAYITEAIPIIKTGYTAKWYQAPNYSTEWNMAAAKVTDNQTLRANWTPITYTVKFDANGGTGAAEQEHTYDTALNLKSYSNTGIIRTGYTFAGWAESSSGTVKYTDEYSVKNLRDAQGAEITLYAKWTINQYTINFETDGGSKVDSKQVFHGDKVAKPSDPFRNGYAFVNWYTGTDFSVLYDFSADITKNETVYANWTAAVVTFDKNGGDTEASQRTMTVPVPATNLGGLPATPPTREHYTFAGWNMAANGLGVVFTADTTVTGNTTVYAKWTSVSVSGVSLNKQTLALYFGETETLTATVSPHEALNKNVNWSSSAPGIASVDQNGKVNANTAGKVTITVTTADGSKTDKCEVTVRLLEMVQITGGSFQLGKELNTANGSDETPTSTVTLTGFYLGMFQVTQAQYQAVMGTNPSYFHGGSGREPASSETQNRRPVEYVRWYDAIVFCNKLSVMEGLTAAYEMQTETNTSVWSTDTSKWGTVPTGNNTRWNAVRVVSGSTGYRLPTEAQWEYAAKGGNGSPGNYTYAGSNNPDLTAWHLANSENKTHEVGKKTANGLGLYDMSGNITEWCWDWFGNYTNVAKNNPTGMTSGTFRVGRGGNWSDNLSYVRSVDRDDYSPHDRYSYIGFRVSLP